MKTQKKWRTIRFKKIRHEVPECLPGPRVTIYRYYMPWNKTCIYYGDDMKKAPIVDPLKHCIKKPSDQDLKASIAALSSG